MVFRPLLAAALLLAAFTPAAGQSAGDPLAQDYEPSPAMWKLADEDTTIYLFGTIHLLPEGFRWRTAEFDRIAADVDALVLESNEADAVASLEVLAPKMRSLQEGRTRTSQRLSPELRANWRQMIEASGRDYSMVDAMPLPLAMLGFDSGDRDRGLSQHELGVETVLTAEFEASGRPVGSIENYGAVMLSLMRMDEAPILAELEAELARAPEKPAPAGSGPLAQGADDWALEHSWARGQVDPNFDLGMGNGKIGTAFQNVLLARRNEGWSHWLKARLEQPGTILVAVGAGHFEGRRSLHYFLEQRGLRAERIN